MSNSVQLSTDSNGIRIKIDIIKDFDALFQTIFSDICSGVQDKKEEGTTGVYIMQTIMVRGGAKLRCRGKRGKVQGKRLQEEIATETK